MIDILGLLPTVSSIAQIVDTLFSIKEKLKSEKKEQRQNVSALLQELSVLIEDISRDLEAGIYPAGKCAKMEYYSLELYNVLIRKITQEKAQTVFEWLKQAVNVEQLLSQLSTIPAEDKDKNIQALLILSGKISAFADLIKYED